MFCRSCGKELADNTLVCPFCNTDIKTDKKSKTDRRPFVVIAISIILIAAVTTVIMTKGFGLFANNSSNNDESHPTTETTTQGVTDTEPTASSTLPSEQYI